MSSVAAPAFRYLDELLEQSPHPTKSAFDISTVTTICVAPSLLIIGVADVGMSSDGMVWASMCQRTPLSGSEG